MLRLKVVAGAAVAGAVAAFVLLPTGYFGPLSARVRGLFVQARPRSQPISGPSKDLHRIDSCSS